jgi:hypothetical protein
MYIYICTYVYIEMYNKLISDKKVMFAGSFKLICSFTSTISKKYLNKFKIHSFCNNRAEWKISVCICINYGTEVQSNHNWAMLLWLKECYVSSPPQKYIIDCCLYLYFEILMFILCNFSRCEGKVIQGRLVSGFGKGIQMVRWKGYIGWRLT